MDEIFPSIFHNGLQRPPTQQIIELTRYSPSGLHKPPVTRALISLPSSPHGPPGHRWAQALFPLTSLSASTVLFANVGECKHSSGSWDKVLTSLSASTLPGAQIVGTCVNSRHSWATVAIAALVYGSSTK